MLVLRDERNLPRNPETLKAELLSQASRLGVRLNVKSEGRYPTGPNGEKLPSYSVVTGCDVGGSLEQAKNLLPILDALLEPASADEVEAWLAELSVVVARRPGDEFSEALRLDAYTSRLRQYPADVVHKALLKKTWKFWPTWEELERECERHTSPRRHMRHACANPRPQSEPEPAAPRVSGDAAQRIMQEAGFTPKRFGQVQARPMAGSQRELDEKTSEKRKPHWSEEAAPDDPRHEILRQARAQNAMMSRGTATEAAE